MKQARPVDDSTTSGASWVTVAIAGLTAVTVAAVVAVTPLPSGAVHAPIGAHPLTERHEFTDDVAVEVRSQPEGRERNVVTVDDASNMAVTEFTVEPGVQFPWHTHPGPVLVSVLEGELVYAYADDCVERHYGAGTAFVDPGNSVHTAFKPSETERTVVIATFLGAPDEGPLTLPVDEERQARLNEKCSF